MPNEVNSSKKDIDLTWYEHIRKRPQMYMGSLNNRGFVNMLKGIMDSSICTFNSNQFTIDLRRDVATFRLNHYNGSSEIDWGQFGRYLENQFTLEISILNALSDKFSIAFLNSNFENIREQYFEKGKIIEVGELTKDKCVFIDISFSIDRSIFGTDFSWNIMYILHQLKEYTFLNKGRKFELKYLHENEDCKVIFYSKNGLKDRIDIARLDINSYMGVEMNTKIEDIAIELALAFKEYSFDRPYLKSYGNSFYIPQEGSHVEGVLKGLTNGVKKFIQMKELKGEYDVSVEKIRENLISSFNVKLDNPNFYGSTKDKLVNPEIIEPISNHIAEILLEKMEEDKESSKKLTEKFKI